MVQTSRAVFIQSVGAADSLLSRLHSGTSHPRSVASGAVRSISPDRGKLAHLDFIAFELIKENASPTKKEQLVFLRNNHFSVVQHTVIDKMTSPSALRKTLETWVPDGFTYPVDGLVIEYDDIAYGQSLGATAHHEKRMTALKWQDEMKKTVFRGVDLITTRTGAVSIVAVTKDTDYLIYGSLPGSEKVGEALKHGVNMISEKTFGEMMVQNR